MFLYSSLSEGLPGRRRTSIRLASLQELALKLVLGRGLATRIQADKRAILRSPRGLVGQEIVLIFFISLGRWPLEQVAHALDLLMCEWALLLARVVFLYRTGPEALVKISASKVFEGGLCRLVSCQ